MKLSSLSLFAVILFIPGIIKAQSKLSSFEIIVQNESISFPLTRFGTINPGIEAGIRFGEKEKTSFRAYYTAAAGFFHHDYITNAFYLKAGYSRSYRVLKHFAFNPGLSAGYLHSFYPGELYEPGPSGEFEKVWQSGRAHAVLDADLRLSYKSGKSVEPFLSVGFMLESPFANGIPVFPHSMYRLGVNFKLKKDE